MAKTQAGDARIRISGWTYPPWRKTFYPDKLTQHRELVHASSVFRSIEINGTFYSLQKPESFEKWAGETPAEFAFSVKAPRYITHIQRLKEAEAPLANFFASGLLKLGSKLGPIFWQLPPNFKFDAKRIEGFLKLLPHDTKQAAKLAKNHNAWMAKRAWTKTDEERPLRHAMEIRHESFRTPEFVELLRKYSIALICADTVEWARMMDVTPDFMYCRQPTPRLAMYSSISIPRRRCCRPRCTGNDEAREQTARDCLIGRAILISVAPGQGKTAEAKYHRTVCFRFLTPRRIPFRLNQPHLPADCG